MDIEAFEKTVLPVKDKLFRFAMRLLDSEDDAKDVVQEVFVRVWNARSEDKTVRNWEAWCMRMTRNLSLDRLRAISRRPSYPLEAGYGLPHQDPPPDVSAELAEGLKKIKQIIAALPEKQRQVMHLRDVEGYSYLEICEILELDINQVKVSLFRARNTVRDKILKIDAYGL